MADTFQDILQNPEKGIPPTDEQIVKEIEAENEKDYYKQLKKKNKNYLIKLDVIERERIAAHICKLYSENKTYHQEICDRIDEYDEVYKMKRKEMLGDKDNDMPNYRTPLSAVTLEVIHANIMNVFFTPKDILRVIPTEENDIPKVKKLDIFGNWSVDNELNIFEGADRLFHSSGKNGECPYMVHWVKEYGTEIVREILKNPANPTEPLYDPDTQEPLYQEIEKQKLLYNAPKLEILSRKDYIQPKNSIMDQLPDWEMIVTRKSYDVFLEEELQGLMYAGSIKDISGWPTEEKEGMDKLDFESNRIPVGEWNNMFLTFFGKLRINILKEGKENEAEETQELADEFIAVVHYNSQTLCSLRKNKFPLKMRPVDMDYLVPDDEGRREGRGIVEIMDGPQKCYDALFNQYVFGTIQSNNPIVFFSPMGNTKNEPIKLKSGYAYPSADPNGVKAVQLPPPNQHLQQMLELVSYWAQMLFGISDYSAGMESKIDPSAPAKKAEIVVAQGSVRLNLIIKRKNNTLQNIFKRWFLLYQENIPPNKFMRIAGDDKDNPWKFEAVKLEDFALKAIPDFELTGNILNVNKTLEANKKLAIYNILSQNALFNPSTRPGLMAYHALTKWIIDGLEETGLSRMIPSAPGEMVHTPEEENARFLQGDYGHPVQGEDHINHIKIHREMLMDSTIPEKIRNNIIAHIQETIKIMQQEVTQQLVMQQIGVQPGQQIQPQQGGNRVVTGRNLPSTAGTVNPMVQQQPAGVG